MIQKVLLRDILEISKTSVNPAKHPNTSFDVYSIPGYDAGHPEKQLGSEIKSTKFVVTAGSILVSKLNPRIPRVWKVAKASENAISSTEFVVLKLKKGYEELFEYIYAALSSNHFATFLQSHVKGTSGSHQRVKPEDIYDYRVTIDPPNSVKVGDFIRNIDEKIELNRQMNETLEQMGQALFRHYFIDNPEAGKWEEESLDKIADFLNGLAMQKYPKIDGEPTLPVIKIREMSSGITANTDIASANIPEQYVVRNGDLLFSWSGTLLVKFWAEGDGALNQHLFKVSSENYPEWLYYYWTKHHLDYFIQTAKSKATTMGHIQRKHLAQARVRVPDTELLEKIGNQIQPLIDMYKEKAQQIQTLTTLRDTLLPRLINGKVKIP